MVWENYESVPYFKKDYAKLTKNVVSTTTSLF